MLDIGEHQFLLLLLVVQAQNDPSRSVVMKATCEELFHRFVHMCTKGEHLIERRTRKRSAQLLLRSLLAERVVITVEQPAKLFAKALVIRKKGQHKRLEKPGCMRLVPLHRTSLR